MAKKKYKPRFLVKGKSETEKECLSCSKNFRPFFGLEDIQNYCQSCNPLNTCKFCNAQYYTEGNNGIFCSYNCYRDYEKVEHIRMIKRDPIKHSSSVDLYNEILGEAFDGKHISKRNKDEFTFIIPTYIKENTRVYLYTRWRRLLFYRKEFTCDICGYQNVGNNPAYLPVHLLNKQPDYNDKGGKRVHDFELKADSYNCLCAICWSHIRYGKDLPFKDRGVDQDINKYKDWLEKTGKAKKINEV